MILVVSHPADLHASTVLARLASIGADAMLIDIADFPENLRLRLEATDAQFGAELDIGGQCLFLRDITAVWWRRPQAHALAPNMASRDDWNFAYGECQAAMSGLFSCVDAFWINPPLNDEKAAQKVYQLKLAQQLGLRIPRTAVTNDPAAARAFIAREGDRGTIYKAFSATRQAWRETRLLRREEIELLDSVRHAPVIFQEYIEAEVDLRITVVGGKIFPAAIFSQDTEYKMDFRMHIDSARYAAHVLPGEIETKLQQYMKALGLVYGAIDMRMTPKGEYVFLEINPCGQWLFVEQKTGQDITGALTDELIRDAKSSRTSRRMAAE
jgi:glutathione synthase/RimK-type ligase-like ATP-grasp enzyme